MKSIRAFVLAAAVVLGPWSSLGSTSPAGPQERLYLLDPSGGILVTYDPVTLERLSLQITGTLKGLSSLTYGNGQLLSIESNVGVLMDKLITIHPASGLAVDLGPTGISYSKFPCIKYDPSRGMFFVLSNFGALFSINPHNGAMTQIARLYGAPTFDGPTSMAISPAGEAFVFQASYGVQGPGVARMDLTTGAVAPIGRLPIGIGRFRDTSFDSGGRLWALYDDGVNHAKDGIYVVDPEALTFEPKLLTKDFPLSGMNSIAVVPIPPISTFCRSTSVSTCSPHIDASGLPSASASSGFTVSVADAPNGSLGLLFYGSGAQSPPLARMGLCFAPPYLNTALAVVTDTGLGGACAGAWSVDLNPALLATGTFAPGDTLRAQWVGFDPAASSTARRVVSDALEFGLAP